MTAQPGQGRQGRPAAAGKNASRWLIAAAMAAGVVGLRAAPAMAQAVGAQRPAVQPPPLSPLAAARQKVNDAEIALTQARQDQDKVVQGVRAWFGQKSDFIAAEAKVKQAQADYDAAIKPVKDKVDSSQAYQDLVAQKTEAQKTLDSASDPNATVSNSDLSAAAGALVKARLAMIDMENDALSNDAKVAQTKAALKEAKAELAALQVQVTDALATNPDYFATSKVVQQKQDNLQQAQDALAQQVKSNRPQPTAQPPRAGG